MQIEYGFESAKRASTATVINLDVGNGDPENAILVLVRNGDKMFQLSLEDDLWLVTTGLVGDGIFLARLLRRFCQDSRVQRGEPPAVREVAQQAAWLQHQLTRQETYRPLGCTAIVIGVDPRERKTKIFRTDPGGVLEAYRFCSAGKDEDQVMKELAKEWQVLANRENYDGIGKLLRAGLVEGSDGADFWIIRPHEQGNRSKVRCYVGVDRQTLNKISAREQWRGKRDTTVQ